jgi:hypothetical protein
MFTTTPSLSQRLASCQHLLRQQPLAFAEPQEQGAFVSKSTRFAFEVKPRVQEDKCSKWVDSTFSPLIGLGAIPAA